MNRPDFTATLSVANTPKEAFDAITNVRGWWSEEIEGGTENLNDVFDYHFEDIHRCRIKLIEVVPDQKVVWLVLENYFKPGIFANAADTASEEHPFDQTEWVNTKIHFEIGKKDNRTQVRFTHEGLVPGYECFEICSNGWNHYIRESLLSLIVTGQGKPNKTGTPMTTDEEKIKAASEVI
jgi:hypothetical protein